jgi:regulator of protease activity HflC (stomatin/prohibitin superfamily)
MHIPILGVEGAEASNKRQAEKRLLKDTIQMFFESTPTPEVIAQCANAFGFNPKDLQEVITGGLIQKAMCGDAKAFEVFKQYRNLKNISNDLITPVVQRSIESVTTQYNIIDVLGAERNNVYKQIEADLKTRLEANGITFILINFDDTDAGDEIEAAIQREAIAKKDAETAEQQRLKNLTEQQQKVDNANVEKQEAEIKAQTTKINAEAEAIRYKIISDAITPQLIEKWTADARIAHGWVTVKGGNVITDNR